MRAALAEGGWEIVLSDYALPSFSAIAALQVLHETGLDIPFIIISGTIGEETAVAALVAGAHDFLVKGNFARLGPGIERCLVERQGRAARREAENALRESESRFRGLAEELGQYGLDVEAGVGTQNVELPMAVIHPDVAGAGAYRTTAPGGRGAVREVCDAIVAARMRAAV